MHRNFEPQDLPKGPTPTEQAFRVLGDAVAPMPAAHTVLHHVTLDADTPPGRMEKADSVMESAGYKEWSRQDIQGHTLDTGGAVPVQTEQEARKPLNGRQARNSTSRTRISFWELQKNPDGKKAGLQHSDGGDDKDCALNRKAERALETHCT